MKNPLTDDGLYLITKPVNDHLIAKAFKVAVSKAPFANGRRVLWTWTQPGWPFDLFLPGHTHESVVDHMRGMVQNGKLKTKNKPQPIAFVDHTGVWVFRNHSKDEGITSFINEVMRVSTGINVGSLRLSLLDSDEDRVLEAFAKDPDMQTIRDLVTRIGRENKG